MLAGSGPGKNPKNGWKMDRKMRGFGRGKHAKTPISLGVFAKYEVFAFSEKVEKSMPKWLPKSMKIGPKSDLEPTQVDCDTHSGNFGRNQKIMNF